MWFCSEKTFQVEQKLKHYNTSGTEVRSNRDVTHETLTERLELRLKTAEIYE